MGRGTVYSHVIQPHPQICQFNMMLGWASRIIFFPRNLLPYNAFKIIIIGFSEIVLHKNGIEFHHIYLVTLYDTVQLCTV